MSSELFNAIVQLKEKESVLLAAQAMRSGEDLIQVVDTCRDAMAEVGTLFERNEYFLPELVFAAEIFKGIMAMLEPQLLARAEGHETIGTVVIGTVQGDVHDIGKNIVVAMLRGNGFQVHDLGVDVAPEKFVHKTAETAATIVGMSALISAAWASMKKTVQALVDSDLRGRVRIVVGGGLVDEQVAQYVGADAYARDVIHGVTVCKRWARG